MNTTISKKIKRTFLIDADLFYEFKSKTSLSKTSYSQILSLLIKKYIEDPDFLVSILKNIKK
jgi:hypothetical protein